MTTVSIIIPVYGPEHFLTACLGAIDRNTGRDDYEVVIVDNATGFDMVNAPNLQALVRNPVNEGYAAANNMGARCATSEILCFLNVDTEVQPGWLSPLLTAFDDPEVAMAGPKIVHPAGDVQTTGIRTWHGNGSAGGEERKDEHPTEDVDGVTGACMLIRAEIFAAMGGFDTNLWMGYEDVDLCLSLREAEHRIRYVSESTIVHFESATGPERWAKVHENIAYTNSKWGNR